MAGIQELAPIPHFLLNMMILLIALKMILTVLSIHLMELLMIITAVGTH